MKISIIGTGHMGLAMLSRLNTAPFECMAYNRSPERLNDLPDGVVSTGDITEAISFAEVAIFIVSDADAILSLLDGQNLTNKIILQMGTIAPDQSLQCADTVTNMGGQYLEAPVLGSIPESAAGTLLIMTGGDNATFERCQPILQRLGKSVRHIGSVGQAAAIKLALNQLIASLTSAFSLTVGFLQNNQLEIDPFMEILRESALYAPTFDKKLQKMLDRDFESANFPMQHLLKDVGLFLQSPATKPLDSRFLESIQQTLIDATPEYSQHDYSALYNQVNPKV